MARAELEESGQACPTDSLEEFPPEEQKAGHTETLSQWRGVVIERLDLLQGCDEVPYLPAVDLGTKEM